MSLPDQGLESVHVNSFCVSTLASFVHSVSSLPDAAAANEAFIRTLIFLLVTVNTGVARVEVEEFCDSVVLGGSSSVSSIERGGIFDP